MKDQIENIITAINKRKKQREDGEFTRATSTSTEIWYMVLELSKEDRNYLRTLLGDKEE